MLTQVRGAEGFRLSMQQQQARHKYDIWPIFAKSEGVTATFAPLVSMPMHTYMGASTIIQEVYFVFLDAHQLQYFLLHELHILLSVPIIMYLLRRLQNALRLKSQWPTTKFAPPF